MNIFQSRINNIIDNHIIAPAIDNIIDNNIDLSDLNINPNNTFIKDTLKKDTFIKDTLKKNTLKKNNDFIELKQSNNTKSKVTKTNGGNIIKLIIILFLLYIIISSNIFTRTVLSIFGKRCIRNGSATCFGVVIQGILLVCFYMLFAYLVNKGAI